jgi:hypothetical protein
MTLPTATQAFGPPPTAEEAFGKPPPTGVPAKPGLAGFGQAAERLGLTAASDISDVGEHLAGPILAPLEHPLAGKPLIPEKDLPSNLLRGYRDTHTPIPHTPSQRFEEGLANFLMGFAAPGPERMQMETPESVAKIANVAGAAKADLYHFGRIIGLKFLPSELEGHASPIATEAEEFAGSRAVQKEIHEHNQARYDDVAGQSIGLDPGTELTNEKYDHVIEEAGQSYDAARQLVQPFTPDPELQDASSNLGADLLKRADEKPEIYHGKPAGTSPSGRPTAPQPGPTVTEVHRLRSILNYPNYSAADALEIIKGLRAEANTGFKAAFSKQDPQGWAVAELQRKAADEIEARLSRAADEQSFAAREAGNGQLADQLADVSRNVKDARRTIARTYDLKKSTVGNHLDPQILRVVARKRPLDGQLAALAKLAEMFPKSVQAASRTATTQSGRMWLKAMAIEGILLFKRPEAAIPVLLEGAARKVAGSGMFQPARWEKELGENVNDELEGANEERVARTATRAAEMKRSVRRHGAGRIALGVEAEKHAAPEDDQTVEW